MQVKLLTTEQKDLLVGVEITDSHFYNPVQDVDGNWYISQQECDQTTNPDYLWVKELPDSEFKRMPFNLSEFNVN